MTWAMIMAEFFSLNLINFDFKVFLTYDCPESFFNKTQENCHHNRPNIFQKKNAFKFYFCSRKDSFPNQKNIDNSKLGKKLTEQH